MDKVVIPAFERNHLHHDADILSECGKFINTIVCNDCNTKHFLGFRRCRNRFCTKCAYVRSLAWLAVLMPILKDWIDKGFYLQMLTLTVRDGDNLTERLDYITGCWRTFYNSRSIRDKWKKTFPGGLRSLEIKLGKGSGKWHPHMHCLVMKNEFSKDYDWLKNRWKEITDNNGSVDIRALRKDNLLKSAAEVVKYIMKPETSLYADDVIFNQLYVAIKGRRQVSTWGLLRHIKEKELEEAIESHDEQKLESFVCAFCGCTQGELQAFLYDDVRETKLLNVISPK